MAKSMYYNWRTIDGYNAPITIVVSTRGLGKTFGRVLKAFRRLVKEGKRFVYVVTTDEDVKTLSANRGERFFAGIKEYLSNKGTKTAQKLYDAIFGGGKSEIEEGDTDLEDNDSNHIFGGTIKINGETAGYLIATNAFGSIKRNNFVNIGDIIFDEFIPEQINITHLDMPRKVVSVIQSVARMQDVRIYMLGNAIRLDDIMLVKMGCANMKMGEIRKIKDKYGLLVVAHYVDRNDYSEFVEKADASVAGRIAVLLGEDNLDKNEFKNKLPIELQIPEKRKSSSLLFCLHGATDSIRIHATKDYQNYYVLSDYGDNTGKRYCFDKKYQNNVVTYRPEWKDILLMRFVKGEILFESSVQYLNFKLLLNLDVNS